jgi:Protein of unknown function (DUF1572)
MTDLATVLLAETSAGYRAMKELADRAIAQVNDDELLRAIDDEANSIAVIMRHMAGNMRSRWTDLFTSDGEKPDRDRDREFETPPARSREAIAADWESGWKRLFDTLEALAPDDLLRVVTIRSEPYTVVRALERQTRHYSQHVGQIVLLAKHWRGREWKSLSIPRGQSAAYLGRTAQKP